MAWFKARSNSSRRYGFVSVGTFSVIPAATPSNNIKFGEALRRELKGEGIHVITVYPVATDTPMMASSKAGPDLVVQAAAPARLIEGGLPTEATVA
jgi:uncharacterized oxidoreductase